MHRRCYFNGWEVMKMSASQVMVMTSCGVKCDPPEFAHVYAPVCTHMHLYAPQSKTLSLTLVDLQKDCHHYPRHYRSLRGPTQGHCEVAEQRATGSETARALLEAGWGLQALDRG